MYRPNIAFAGLTAAGKTTHAKILAEQLGYKWISASALLVDILGLGSSSMNPETMWFTDYTRIQQAREDDRIDIELERRVKALADERDGLLLDTWAMAYIYEGPLIRLWIESDETSRMRKCYLSQGQKKLLSLDQCRQLICEKDSSAHSKFLARLHFDLFTDMSRYDAILENTHLIPEATDACAQKGIQTFTSVVSDVVGYLINQALHMISKESVQSLHEKHGFMVRKLNRKPWSL